MKKAFEYQKKSIKFDEIKSYSFQRVFWWPRTTHTQLNAKCSQTFLCLKIILFSVYYTVNETSHSSRMIRHTMRFDYSIAIVLTRPMDDTQNQKTCKTINIFSIRCWYVHNSIQLKRRGFIWHLKWLDKCISSQFRSK